MPSSMPLPVSMSASCTEHRILSQAPSLPRERKQPKEGHSRYHLIRLPTKFPTSPKTHCASLRVSGITSETSQQSYLTTYRLCNNRYINPTQHIVQPYHASFPPERNQYLRTILRTPAYMYCTSAYHICKSISMHSISPILSFRPSLFFSFLFLSPPLSAQK